VQWAIERPGYLDRLEWMLPKGMETILKARRGATHTCNDLDAVFMHVAAHFSYLARFKATDTERVKPTMSCRPFRRLDRGLENRGVSKGREEVPGPLQKLENHDCNFQGARGCRR
jgi:hypothetical protein